MGWRRSVVFPLVTAGLLLSTLGPAGPAGAQIPPEDRGRGVVLAGLKRSPSDGPCRGKYELAHRDQVGGVARTLCTHGPDPAPEGVDVRTRRPPQQAFEAVPPSGVAAATPAAVPCYGDGSDGYRIQVIYARASDVADRYADYASSFVQWTAVVDTVVSASAAESGGIRHARFVTDAACNLVVDRVVLSTTGDDTMSNTISELRSLGYARTDRKYLVYTDANVYCGIGQIYFDDSPDRTPGANANNGHPQVQGMVARVDNGCWGRTESVEAHELMHNLGGVQDTAPHATPNSHCTDETDLMCYSDGSGLPLTYPCATGHENRFDCGHDDYFSTAPPALSYLATHWNAANSAFLATTEPPQRARYNPLTPARLLDTRVGTGAPAAAVGPGGTVQLQVTGRGGVPATGVSAVVLNVTVTQPSASSHLTVFPTGEPVPSTANLNFVGGQTVPNLVVAKLGSGGKVSLYNQAGSVHVIADVSGWYDTGAAASGSRYNPLTPVRILDTRVGTGAPAAAVGPGGTVQLQVTGRGGVPATGVAAVVLNVTVTQPTASSHLTAFPTGEALPSTANLNFVPGQTVPNLVIAKLGAGGRVSLNNYVGSVHVIADVSGWYDTGTATTGARYNPLTPSRLLDTRVGTGAPAAAVGPGGTVQLQVTGRGGVPASGVSAVVLNVTVTQPTAASHLTAFPSGQALPSTANLNFVGGQTVPNLVVAKLGTGGKVSLNNYAGNVHVIADVAGWYDTA